MISPQVSAMGPPLQKAQKADSLSPPALGPEEPAPKEPVKELTTGLKRSEITASDTAALRALLVEDNEINLRLLIACMQKLRLSHLAATNGLEALQTYKSNKGRFDVVFMGSWPTLYLIPQQGCLLTSAFHHDRYLYANYVWY